MKKQKKINKHITHITTSSIFDDLGFDKAEAENLKMRAALMRIIQQHIKSNKLTQEAAAKLMGVTQPRISDLARGKISLFTIDMLVNMLTKAHVPVSLVVNDRLAA